MRPRLLLFITAFLFSTAARPSAGQNADPTKSSLRFHESGDAQCLNADLLSAAVEKRLGRQVFVSVDDADVGVFVQVNGSDDAQLTVSVVLTHRGTTLGTRELTSHGAPCEKFAQTVALVVAMLVDVPRNELEQRAEALTEKDKSATESKVAATSVARVKPKKAKLGRKALPPIPEPPPENLVHLSLLTAIDSGTIPGPAIGTAFAVHVPIPGFFPVRLSIDEWPVATREAAAGKVTFTGFVGGAGIVWPTVHLARSLRLFGWLSAELEVLLASSRGFRKNRTLGSAFPRLGFGARIEQDLGTSLFLCSELGGHVPLERPGFIYELPDGRKSEVFRVPALTLSTGLGVGWKF